MMEDQNICLGCDPGHHHGWPLAHTCGNDENRQRLTVEDIRRAKVALERENWFAYPSLLKRLELEGEGYRKWLIDHPEAEIEAVPEVRARIELIEKQISKFNFK